MKTKTILILAFLAAVISFTANARLVTVPGFYQGAIFEITNPHKDAAPCATTIITKMEDPARYEGAEKLTIEHILAGQIPHMDKEINMMPDTHTFVYAKEIGRKDDECYELLIRVTGNEMVYNTRFLELYPQTDGKTYRFSLTIDAGRVAPLGHE